MADPKASKSEIFKQNKSIRLDKAKRSRGTSGNMHVNGKAF